MNFALLDIEEAVGNPALDPRVYVEPKDRDGASEIARQSAFVVSIRKHAKRCVVFAVPNSAQSSRTKLRQHREGAAYGAADLVITWTGGVAFVEMKAGETMPRANQIEFLNRLAAQEHPVAVCRTSAGALRWLRSVGAPVPQVTA